MPDQLSNLVVTDKQVDATHVKILSVRLQGCNVTEGRIYKIERERSHDGLFENGEMYVIDDKGRPNYSVFMICKKEYYK